MRPLNEMQLLFALRLSSILAAETPPIYTSFNAALKTNFLTGVWYTQPGAREESYSAGSSFSFETLNLLFDGGP